MESPNITNVRHIVRALPKAHAPSGGGLGRRSIWEPRLTPPRHLWCQHRRYTGIQLESNQLVYPESMLEKQRTDNPAPLPPILRRGILRVP